jgi:hypothetical protein
VTPQIVLLTTLEFEDCREENNQVYRLISRSLVETKQKELNDTFHGTYSQPQAQSSAREKGAESELENGSRKHALSIVIRRKGVYRDTQDTWLRMLRELHVLTYKYWPDDCSTFLGLVQTEKGSLESHMDAGIDSSKSWLLGRSTIRHEQTWNHLSYVKLGIYAIGSYAAACRGQYG